MTANIITSIRILCSVALLFCPPLSVPFYVLYLLAGISDILDGIAARKLGIVSEFGSKLDTAADFVFVVVCLIKLIPIVEMTCWMYIAIGIVVLIKAINLISGFVMQKKPVVVHSVMNKVTGGLMFALPLSFKLVDLKYSAAVVCAVAAFAAIQEGHIIRTGQGEKK